MEQPPIRPTTEAGKIAELAVAAEIRAPHIITNADGRQFSAVPDGYTLTDITPPGAAKSFKPDHIAQSVSLQTAASLSDYVDRFKTDQTTLFANIDANSIVAAIDYHGPTSAELVKHKATLKLPFSQQWAIWDSQDGKLTSQLDFARFLEENARDITDPDTATLLEAVQAMTAVEKADFRQRIRTNSDNVDFTYSVQTDAGMMNGEMAIPKRFALAIPVYFGGDKVPLEARLRWRKTQDGLQLGYQILLKDQARQDEFMGIVSAVAASADVPALYGALA